MAIAHVDTQVNTGSFGTGPTITKPTGLATGHFMLAVLSCDSGGTWSTPANWTPFNGISTTHPRSAVFYKIADAADVAASNFTFSGSGSVWRGGSLSAYSGVDTTDPVTGFSEFDPEQMVGNGMAGFTLYNQSYIINFATRTSAVATTWVGATERSDVQISNTAISVADGLVTSAGKGPGVTAGSTTGGYLLGAVTLKAADQSTIQSGIRSWGLMQETPSGTSHVIRLPRFRKAGDLCYVWLHAPFGSPQDTNVSGWLWEEDSYGKTYVRVLDGTEGDTLTINLSGGTPAIGVALTWTVHGYGGLTDAVESGGSTTSASTASISFSEARAVNLVIGMMDSSSSGNTIGMGAPAGMTELADVGFTQQSVVVGYQAYSASGSTGTRACTSAGTSNWSVTSIVTAMPDVAATITPTTVDGHTTIDTTPQVSVTVTDPNSAQQHVRRDWQFSTDPTFTTGVQNVTSSSYGVLPDLDTPYSESPTTAFSVGQTMYWRARVREVHDLVDNGGNTYRTSAWTTARTVIIQGDRTITGQNDSAGGIEAQFIRVSGENQAGSGTEAATLTVILTSNQSGTGTEGVAGFGPSDNQAGTATESQSIRISGVGDTAVGTEGALTPNVAHTQADTGGHSEADTLGAWVAAQNQAATATDLGVIRLNLTDTSSATEASTFPTVIWTTGEIAFTQDSSTGIDFVGGRLLQSTDTSVPTDLGELGTVLSSDQAGSGTEAASFPTLAAILAEETGFPADVGTLGAVFVRPETGSAVELAGSPRAFITTSELPALIEATFVRAFASSAQASAGTESSTLVAWRPSADAVAGIELSVLVAVIPTVQLIIVAETTSSVASVSSNQAATATDTPALGVRQTSTQPATAADIGSQVVSLLAGEMPAVLDVAGLQAFWTLTDTAGATDLGGQKRSSTDQGLASELATLVAALTSAQQAGAVDRTSNYFDHLLAAGQLSAAPVGVPMVSKTTEMGWAPIVAQDP